MRSTVPLKMYLLHQDQDDDICSHQKKSQRICQPFTYYQKFLFFCLFIKPFPKQGLSREELNYAQRTQLRICSTKYSITQNAFNCGLGLEQKLL